MNLDDVDIDADVDIAAAPKETPIVVECPPTPPSPPRPSLDDPFPLPRLLFILKFSNEYRKILFDVDVIMIVK
jgi:hypothetical protein